MLFAGQLLRYVTLLLSVFHLASALKMSYVDEKGEPLTEALIDIDLEAYERMSDNGNQLERRDLTWYTASYFNGTVETTGLDKRTNIQACVAWITNAVNCVELTKRFYDDIWELAMRIKQKAGLNDCKQHCGNIGAIHYNFWNAGGECDTKAQVKTIAGAIDDVLKHESGKWLCNTYCITLRHGELWTGHVKISTSSICGSGGCSQYDVDRCYDAGCQDLEGVHVC